MGLCSSRSRTAEQVDGSEAVGISSKCSQPNCQTPPQRVVELTSSSAAERSPPEATGVRREAEDVLGGTQTHPASKVLKTERKTVWKHFFPPRAGRKSSRREEVEENLKVHESGPCSSNAEQEKGSEAVGISSKCSQPNFQTPTDSVVELACSSAAERSPPETRGDKDIVEDVLEENSTHQTKNLVKIESKSVLEDPPRAGRKSSRREEVEENLKVQDESGSCSSSTVNAEQEIFYSCKSSQSNFQTPTNSVVELNSTLAAERSPSEIRGDKNIVEDVLEENSTHQTKKVIKTERKRKTLWKRLFHHKAEKKFSKKSETEDNMGQCSLNKGNKNAEVEETDVVCNSDKCTQQKIPTKKMVRFKNTQKPPSETGSDRDVAEDVLRENSTQQEKRKSFWKHIFHRKAGTTLSKKEETEGSHQVKDERNSKEVVKTNKAQKSDEDKHNLKAKTQPAKSEQKNTKNQYCAKKENIKNVYEVGSKIGQGGGGAVYEGKRLSDGLEVALKFVCKREWGDSMCVRGYITLFPLEVGLMILMQKGPPVPEIIQLIEWYNTPRNYILVLERPPNFVEMTTFLSENKGILSEDKARIVMRQVVKAACTCLERGVFHRDIKLQNLLVNKETLDVKLIDFGCGIQIKNSGYRTFSGTFLYCPPEVYIRERYYAEPTTVWSLGILLYRIVCGSYPYGFITNILNSRSFRDERLTPELCNLIRSCTESRPEDRIRLNAILQHYWFKEQQPS